MKLLFALFVLGCKSPQPVDSALTLEPTIEGFGAAARGGEGGVVLTVSSLEDSGPGSLREVLAAVDGPAEVQFSVEGEIELQSTILVPSRVTIDGQGKVTLRGQGLYLHQVEDVILRDLRFRDIRGPGDAVTIEGGRLVLIWRCDFDNAGLDPTEPDEFVAVVWGATDVTIAWSRFANTDKVFLFGNGDAPPEVDGDIRVTLHDLFMQNNGRRHPFLRYGQVDMYNCVISDWSLKTEKTYGLRVADGGRLLAEGVWFEQDSEAPDFTGDPAQAVALLGSPWLGTVVETEDAHIALVDPVQTDPRIVLDQTGEAFERPYAATVQDPSAAWRAALEAAVGPQEP